MRDTYHTREVDPREELATMQKTLQGATEAELVKLVEQYIFLSACAGNQESIFHRWAAACEEECARRGRINLYTGLVRRLRQRVTRTSKD